MQRISGDCKSAHVSVRRFESFPTHHFNNQGVTLVRDSFFVVRETVQLGRNWAVHGVHLGRKSAGFVLIFYNFSLLF